jgi:hypothetical protein
VAPEVRGRVLDAESHEPIKDVIVRREAEVSSRPMEPSKGGQTMKAQPFVRTVDDGTFVLDSVRDIAFFRTVGLYSVNLSFEHRAYERFTASYNSAHATNSVSGEPVINTGDILLKARTRTR